MKTPKKEAKELLKLYYNYITPVTSKKYTKSSLHIAKQCALIAIYKVLEVVPQFESEEENIFTLEYQYYLEVKKAIEDYE